MRLRRQRDRFRGFPGAHRQHDVQPELRCPPHHRERRCPCLRRPLQPDQHKVRVISVADMFAETIMQVYNHESISAKYLL